MKCDDRLRILQILVNDSRLHDANSKREEIEERK